MLQLFLVLTLYKQPGLAGWPPGRHLRVVTLFPASSMTSTGSARRACAVFKICFQQDSLCLLVFSCFQRVQQASILLCLELTGEFGGIWTSAARSARISSPGLSQRGDVRTAALVRLGMLRSARLPDPTDDQKDHVVLRVCLRVTWHFSVGQSRVLHYLNAP